MGKKKLVQIERRRNYRLLNYWPYIGLGNFPGGTRLLTEFDTEKEVVAEVKQVLISTGLMKRKEEDPGPPSQVQRINTGAFKQGKRFIRSANPGTLDFEGYDNHGRILGFECKRPKGGRLSPEQKARIDDINAKGGVAGVVRSGAEAAKLLKENGCLN